jgi:hypothetical protein
MPPVAEGTRKCRVCLEFYPLEKFPMCGVYHRRVCGTCFSRQKTGGKDKQYCKFCRTTKKWTAFDGTKVGGKLICQLCWRKRPECGTKPADPEARRIRDRLKTYGLTEEMYQAMLARQKGRCAICRKKPRGKHTDAILHVDHCHETGEVRGLLCSHCNKGLGYFHDQPKMLRRAARYLE